MDNQIKIMHIQNKFNLVRYECELYKLKVTEKKKKKKSQNNGATTCIVQTLYSEHTSIDRDVLKKNFP